MGKLPIDFKIGPVLVEKGTDISVLREQLEETVTSNEEARTLRRLYLIKVRNQLTTRSVELVRH